MADTNHAHGIAHTKEPIEGDGVNYAGIAWFIVILTATTVFCQILVWGGFRLLDYQVRSGDTARAPLSHPAASPSIDRGQVVPNGEAAPQAGMLVDEPMNLADFRRREDASLAGYGWIDQSGGIVRIPIERAKELLLQKGLPTRSAAPPAVPGPVPASMERR